MSWEEDYLMAKVAELDARLAEVEKRTAAPAPDTETGSEYGSWSFADLRTEAKRRGLNAGGTAAELAARLREDDQEIL